MTTLIPPALSRRLILALLGFRFVDGRWWRGRERLSEQAVDALSPAQWGRYVARWRRSAPTN